MGSRVQVALLHALLRLLAPQAWDRLVDQQAEPSALLRDDKRGRAWGCRVQVAVCARCCNCSPLRRGMGWLTNMQIPSALPWDDKRGRDASRVQLDSGFGRVCISTCFLDERNPGRIACGK